MSVWFLVLHEQIIVGWSKHTHTPHCMWHCSAMLLIVHAFVDEILDQIIVILNMTEADVLRLFFLMHVAIFSFCELSVGRYLGSRLFRMWKLGLLS